MEAALRRWPGLSLGAVPVKPNRDTLWMLQPDVRAAGEPLTK